MPSVVLSHVYAWPEVRRGGERYLHELGASLQRRGHVVVILTSGARRERGTELGVPVLRVRRRELLRHYYGRASTEMSFAASAAVEVLRRRPDVWHALGIPDGAMAARLAGRTSLDRAVYTDLGVPVRAQRERWRTHRSYLRIVRDVESYVCLSSYVEGYLQREYARPGLVIPGGVRLSSFEPGGREARPTILYSGSLTEPRKGIAPLLEAVALLRARVPDVQVWLSGSGDASQLLADAPPEARAAVTHVGLDDQSQLAQRYARAWVTALPSTGEAFGMVLIESLASGTPIVTRRDGGGQADILTADVGRDAGAEVHTLASALEETLDLATAPGIVDACRERAALFDWDTAVTPRLEAAYGLA